MRILKRLAFFVLTLAIVCLGNPKSLPIAAAIVPAEVSQSSVSAGPATPIAHPNSSSNSASRSTPLRITSPAVTVHYNYYPITGATVAALQSQMAQLGPISQIEGRHYAANTDWHVKWAYQSARQGNRCAITAAKGTVDITFTLPQWTPSADAPAWLVADWDRFMTALVLHEEGHKSNGIATIEEVLTTLNTQAAYSSCRDLEAATDAALKNVVQRYNRRDIAYDHVTRHGETQGAIFPTEAVNITAFSGQQDDPL